MALTIHEQFLTHLEKAKRPLIILPQTADVDHFTAAFGCAALLAKMQKPVEIATSAGPTPKALAFLKAPAPVRGDLPNIRTLTLHLDTKKADVDELSYDHEEHELKINLVPKTGSWSEQDVRISTKGYKYDLLLCIGAQDLEGFGKLYKRYADFFFETPIINIDHAGENEHFGQLNLVDMNAVACSEVCHDLFEKMDPGMIDEKIATALLAGMIFKTRSFRSPNVTPKTLKVAGSLIGKGARRETIVEQLYKTRTVETLRLWGRALARLKADKKRGFVWTMLTRQDFANAGAEQSDLDNVIDELMMSSPNASAALVLFEHADGHIAGILRAERPLDALALGAPFRAAGTREQVTLKIHKKDIVKAEKNVVSHVKKVMKG